MKKLYFLASLLFSFTLAIAQVALPLDFESGSITYEFNNFDGGVTTVIANPQSAGINTSTKVAKMVKGAGQTWGGSWIALSNPIDFSAGKLFKMKVFSPRVGAKVLLKVENMTDANVSYQVEVLTTVANTWEELSFDYAVIPTNKQYQKVVVIFDNGTAGDGSANFTFLYDDIKLVSGGSSLTPPVLPLDFESGTTAYNFTNFGGGLTTVLANPQSGGINTSTKVAKMVKGAGETWGGSWIALAAPIDFSAGKIFKMKVYAPRVGAKVLLKVENISDGSVFKEVEVATTSANAWEELSFDFSSINTSKEYQKVVWIFDFGTAGDGSANFTYLFDELKLTAGAVSNLQQMNLPVSFDLSTVDYGLLGFGGAEASTIVPDPTNPGNNVAKVIKSAGAQTWAGTTITAAAQLGFSSKIPFTASETKMSVKVWSPNAGIKVRLKVEDHADATKSVETDATTTVANGWQMMEFNFANQAAGTAALNLAFNYDKASIFFNFGVDGATAGEKTYYFDDVQFGTGVLPISLAAFTAMKKDNGVVLEWTTASESNNKGFAIERSRDGQHWVSLRFVNSHGNSAATQVYKAIDATPEKGMNYYRLKQMDLDGVATYSGVRMVDFAGKQNMSIYPNPARGSFNMLVGNANGKISYAVFNMHGAQVLSGIIPAANSVTPVNVRGLAAGTYIVRIVHDDNVFQERLIIQ